jgi:hypothetical protein
MHVHDKPHFHDLTLSAIFNCRETNKAVFWLDTQSVTAQSQHESFTHPRPVSPSTWRHLYVSGRSPKPTFRTYWQSCMFLANFLGKRPSWATNSPSSSHEISHPLKNMRVHCRAQGSNAVVPILKKTRPVPMHTLTINFVNVCFNIIHPPTNLYSTWL